MVPRRRSGLTGALPHSGLTGARRAAFRSSGRVPELRIFTVANFCVRARIWWNEQKVAPREQHYHPLMDRMRIGVDRGNARGNKTLFFSASAPPIARHTSPPDLAAAPHTPTRRLGAHEQLAESVGTAPLQLGSRQPCRPPPHTRASMAAACVPGLSRPPSRGGSGPLQATGVAGAQVRGRPKLPTPSACTDGSPYRGRLCAHRNHANTPPRQSNPNNISC